MLRVIVYQNFSDGTKDNQCVGVYIHGEQQLKTIGCEGLDVIEVSENGFVVSFVESYNYLATDDVPWLLNDLQSALKNVYVM